MAITVLTDEIWFPHPSNAMEDGLLAIGGDLSTERLLAAYKQGIFPWYDGDIPLWWHPNPRFVLYPSKIKISKSMKVILKKSAFKFSANTAFAQVIQSCANINREGQAGSWLNHEMQQAYTTLHQAGFAISGETYLNNILVGGLYGIKLGNIFFGESMFSNVSNASKFAFIHFAEYLRQQGVVLIDCQVHTEHLESLGAEMISRDLFMEILNKNIK